MSFPCTTMLSFDFFRSRVSISACDWVSLRFNCWAPSARLTVSARIQVDDAPDTHIDDTQEALVLLLELLLVENLHGKHAVLGHPPRWSVSALPATVVAEVGI